MVFAAGVGVLGGEQAVVQADFGGLGVGCGHPGDDAFDLDAGGAGGAAFGVGHDRGLHFGDIACGVFAEAGAFNHVAVFQAHFVADEQTEEPFGWRFFKIGALYPHLFAQLEVAVAQLGVVRVNGGGAGVHDAAIIDHAVVGGRLVGCGVWEQLVPIGEHQFDRV